MHRYLIVMSNCQTGGLDAALSAMFPDDTTIPIAWLDGEPEYLRTHVQGAQIWVSSLPRPDAEALREEVGGTAAIVPVPLLWFPGFHPDLIHVGLRSGGELESAVGPYCSAIAVWSWLQGLDPDATIERFAPATLDALGYTSGWATALAGARRLLEAAETDFDRWYADVAPKGTFMLTDNHPRIEAVIALARDVAHRIGLPAQQVDQPWEAVVPDALAVSSAVWPVYPPIAEAIRSQRRAEPAAHTDAVVGSWLWRSPRGAVLDLPAYLARTFEGWTGVDPADVVVPEHAAERCNAVFGAIS